MRVFVLSGLVAALLSAVLLPARAAVLVDLSPDAIGLGAFTGTATNIYDDQNFATRIVLDERARLSRIDSFAAAGSGTLGGAATLKIFGDGGAVPGALLFSIDSTVAVVDFDGDTTGSLARRGVPVTLILDPGTYWIGVAGGAASLPGDGLGGVQGENLISAASTTVQLSGNAVQFVRPGTSFLRLEGSTTTIPLPATLPLALAAIAGLGLVGRRKA